MTTLSTKGLRFGLPSFPLQQGRFSHNVGSEVIKKKPGLLDESGLSPLARQLAEQIKKYDIKLPLITLPGGVNIAPIHIQPNPPECETVYDIYELPDGFVATFDQGIFHHGDVEKLSAGIQERYKGKELKLVPFSELDGKAYTYDKSTATKIPNEAKGIFILLVENKDIPNGDSLAKAMYFVTQALKQDKHFS